MVTFRNELGSSNIRPGLIGSNLICLLYVYCTIKTFIETQQLNSRKVLLNIGYKELSIHCIYYSGRVCT